MESKTYSSYLNLPPLAGLCSFEAAMSSGLSVETCVDRLKRFHYAFKRLQIILTARIPSEPIYELKSIFSHHAYLCSEHVTALRRRVGEMREPPLGLDSVPHPALQIYFDEIQNAPSSYELILGVYSNAFPSVLASISDYQRSTHPLADAPSLRVLRFAKIELEEIVEIGHKIIEAIKTSNHIPQSNSDSHFGLGAPESLPATPQEQAKIESFSRGASNCSTVVFQNANCCQINNQSSTICDWFDLLDRLLNQAGSLDGSKLTELSNISDKTQHPSTTQTPDLNLRLPTESGAAFQRKYSHTPYQFDPVPKRDSRFPDPYNMGVNAEVFLYDPSMPAPAKTLMMFYKRIREIDVPEMMASIIVETPSKPWDYYRDMSRQLWDEARHAMMGEVGFVNLGIDWSKVMINFTWSLALNTQLSPLERHAVLYFIEQGLMPKTGKRFEWEVSVASQNPLAATFQDFDWADEVLHARIGRDWYVKEFNDAKQAVDYGDSCWSKVLMGWAEWRNKGLTEHRNWWPDVYRQACQCWGLEPDPRILAYNTSYETVRADLKELTGSA